MFNPPQFADTRPEVLHGLIRAYPLGMVSFMSQGKIDATPLPFHLNLSGPAPLIQAHLPRVNPLADIQSGAEVVVTFSGPQAYISPGWYATKAVSHRVVPTWNYVMVQVRGVIRVIDDPVWILEQMTALTIAQEADREPPWRVSDAPQDYIDALIKSLVGVEIEASEITGKWKVSQNQPEANRLGVIAGLTARNDPQALAMAALVAGERKP